MRLVSSPYMRYAKLHQVVHPVRYELSSSGLVPAPVEEWPFVPRLEMRGNNNYGHPQAIEHLAKRYGVSTSSVFPTPGTTVANLLAVGVLSAERPVGMEHPGYEPIRSMIEATGVSALPLPRQPDNQWAIDMVAAEAVFSQGARLLVITDPYNPAGTALETAQLQALDRLAGRYDGWVLVDEIYLDGMVGRRPPAATLGTRMVSTAGFSEIYGVGSLRYGWLLGPPDIIEQARGLADALYALMAYPIEAIAVQVLEHADFFLDRYRRIQGANHRLMEAWLDRHPQLECVRPPGGLIYFPRLPAGQTSPEFDRLLRDQYEVGLAPGHYFGDPQRMRIGIGGPTDLLEAGLDQLSQACFSPSGVA